MCLFIIYIYISIIFSNNQNLQSIWFNSNELLTVFTLVYKYQQHLTLKNHLSTLQVKNINNINLIFHKKKIMNSKKIMIWHQTIRFIRNSNLIPAIILFKLKFIMINGESFLKISIIYIQTDIFCQRHSTQ